MLGLRCCAQRYVALLCAAVCWAWAAVLDGNALAGPALRCSTRTHGAVLCCTLQCGEPALLRSTGSHCTFLCLTLHCAVSARLLLANALSAWAGTLPLLPMLKFDPVAIAATLLLHSNCAASFLSLHLVSPWSGAASHSSFAQPCWPPGLGESPQRARAVPSLRTQESLGLLPCPVIWPVTRRVVWPGGDGPAALTVAAAAASAVKHRSILISLCTSYHLIISTGAYVHSYFVHVLLPSISPGGAGHLRLLSRAQETPSDLP